ncbi:Mitogen-activated protein kinase kinase kinase 2 [Diplonema papillatum]|nr:Mitogen-activated protein kinase kinase kinase 2 [Diplonema papillatum]
MQRSDDTRSWWRGTPVASSATEQPGSSKRDAWESGSSSECDDLLAMGEDPHHPGDTDRHPDQQPGPELKLMINRSPSSRLPTPAQLAASANPDASPAAALDSGSAAGDQATAPLPAPAAFPALPPSAKPGCVVVAAAAAAAPPPAAGAPAHPPPPPPPPVRARRPDAAAKRKGKIDWARGALIGTGSFGKVYRGLDNKTGRSIAVKEVMITTPQILKDLKKEIEVLKTVEHPNIVKYLGLERVKEKAHILMEYVPGGNLASLVKLYKTLMEPVACNYTREILDGVTYLHTCGIVHRDIKGANLLITPEGHIKLVDFGSAKSMFTELNVPHDGDAPFRTIRGTPFWMAPEVIRESGHGPPADIWSVGCTVLEMLTGRPPYSDLGQLQAMHAIASGSGYPPLGSAETTGSEECLSFLRLCLQRAPEKRPKSSVLTDHAWMKMHEGSYRLHCSAAWMRKLEESQRKMEATRAPPSKPAPPAAEPAGDSRQCPPSSPVETKRKAGNSDGSAPADSGRPGHATPPAGDARRAVESPEGGKERVQGLEAGETPGQAAAQAAAGGARPSTSPAPPVLTDVPPVLSLAPPKPAAGGAALNGSPRLPSGSCQPPRGPCAGAPEAATVNGGKQAPAFDAAPCCEPPAPSYHTGRAERPASPIAASQAPACTDDAAAGPDPEVVIRYKVRRKRVPCR